MIAKPNSPTYAIKIIWFRIRGKMIRKINKLWWRHMTGSTIIVHIPSPMLSPTASNTQYMMLLTKLKNLDLGLKEWAWKAQWRSADSNEVKVVFRKGLSKEAMLFALRDV